MIGTFNNKPQRHTYPEKTREETCHTYPDFSLALRTRLRVFVRVIDNRGFQEFGLSVLRIKHVVPRMLFVLFLVV